ncbi:MAG: hypothetical protein PHI11_04990 [Gallionella sp.]|nr:hypothetical protein [Gallionella sp.]
MKPKSPLTDTIIRPLTTVDVVISTVLDARLQVLLVKRPDDAYEPFPNEWALPGGFVNVEKDQDLLIPAPAKLQHSAGAAWFPIAAQQVSVTLAFDHTQLLATALQRLRNKVETPRCLHFTTRRIYPE